MDFKVRSVILLISGLFWLGLVGVSIFAYMYQLWTLAALLTMGAVFTLAPGWICIQQWIAAKNRRRMGRRERRKLTEAREMFYDQRFDVLMNFIDSTDVVDIICGGFLDESSSYDEDDRLIIDLFAINVIYLEY